MLMRKLGYSDIGVAENGQKALEYLATETAKGREKEVECILMDASMDVMNGQEHTRKSMQTRCLQHARGVAAHTEMDVCWLAFALQVWSARA